MAGTLQVRGRGHEARRPLFARHRPLGGRNPLASLELDARVLVNPNHAPLARLQFDDLVSGIYADLQELPSL